MPIDLPALTVERQQKSPADRATNR